MNLLGVKSLLRETLLKKRKNLSLPARRRKSRKIFHKLFNKSAYRQAEKIAIYFHIAPEVETKPFLKKILKEKSVFLPRTVGKKDLALHQIKHLRKDLRRGAYSIMEPKANCPKKAAREMDLVIVPGVGFDRKGNRLGRGAGYYDKLLKKTGRVSKIGICFREQIVKKIPMTKHDKPVNQVITD